MSALENIFLFNWKALGGPKLTREYRFHESRKWRFDFAIPEIRYAFEVEGGTFAKKGKSGHITGVGYGNNCEKYNAAALAGWSVFRFDTKMVRSTKDLEPIIQSAKSRLRQIEHLTF